MAYLSRRILLELLGQTVLGITVAQVAQEAPTHLVVAEAEAVLEIQAATSLALVALAELVGKAARLAREQPTAGLVGLAEAVQSPEQVVAQPAGQERQHAVAHPEMVEKARHRSCLTYRQILTR